MPRLKTDTVGTGDQSWLASLHAVREARSGTLDVSAFTKATHYPNGYFISGLPLGQITATKLYARSTRCQPTARRPSPGTC
jgi:hypothetical protein